jgi:hypothetical protein
MPTPAWHYNEAEAHLERAKNALLIAEKHGWDSGTRYAFNAYTKFAQVHATLATASNDTALRARDIA